MTIRVLYFAALADLTGLREQSIEIEDGASVAAALATIIQHHSALRNRLDSTMTAVNETYVGPDHPLQAGDVLALIPPLSGG